MNICVNNRYTLIKELGFGGMGAVYLCTDKVYGNRHIALKLIKKEIINLNLIKSFKSEFDLMTRLKHPNLIQVYDFGIDKETTQYYITMEYLDGLSLEHRITQSVEQNTALSLETALEYTVQICRALDFIHSRNIIHRDIKPANIMIGSNGVKLMDFGLADLQDQDESSKHKGTLLYMAPEVLHGSISNTIDIYALGITLIEMTCGNTDFIKNQSQNILSYLSDKDTFTDFNKKLVSSVNDYQLQKIINSMITYDPEQRYQSAAEVIEALNKEFQKTYALETEQTKHSYVLGAGFVGRDTELSTLKQFLTDSTIHSMLVSGDAGIGKTRLMQEIKKHCQLNDHIFIEASCFETSKKLYAPFISLINECLYLCHETMIRTYGPDLKILISSHERLQTIEQIMYSDIRTERTMLNKTITEFIIELCCISSYPIALYINDIQWIDEASIEVLTKLLSKITERKQEVSTKIKIFFSCRRESLDLFKDLLTPGTVQHLALQPFDKFKVESYIKAVFGKENIGNNLIHSTGHINAQVSGNPFFLQELIRSLLADNAIVHKSTAWDLECEPEKINLPQNIGDVLLSRYKKLNLNQTEVRILEIICLLDREITYDELDAIMHIELETLKKLEYYEVLRQEIVEEKLFFKMNHAFIQKMIINAIHDPKKIHNFIAEKLELVHCNEIDEYIYSLAYHFYYGDNREKALLYGVKACEKAIKNVETRKALELSNTLLGLYKPGEDDLTKIKLLDVKLLAYLNFSDLDKMNSICIEIEKISELVNNSEYVCKSYMFLGEAHCRADTSSIKALQFLEKALVIASHNDNKQVMAQTLNIMGAYYTFNNDFTKALECHQQSLNIAESINDEITIAFNTGNIGLIHRYKGEYKKALTTNLRTLALVTKLNDKYSLIMGNNLIAEIYYEMHDYSKALEFSDKSISIAQEIEVLIGEFDGLSIKIRSYIALGRIEEAERLYNHFIQLNKKIRLNDEISSSCALINIEIEIAKKNTFKAITILQDLLQRNGTNDYLTATIKFKLWKLTDDQSFRQECLTLYKNLYIKTSKYEFKKLIEELEFSNNLTIEKSNGNSVYLENKRAQEELSELRKQIDEIQDIFRTNDLSTQFQLHETNEAISKKIAKILEKVTYLQQSKQFTDATTESDVHRIHFFQKLLDIIHDMNSNLSLNTLLDKILDASIQLMGAQRGAILLLNNDGILEYKISRTTHTESTLKQSITISQTIVQKVLSTQRAIFVANVADDLDLSQIQSIIDLELRSVMCAPLGRKNIEVPVEKRKYPFMTACQRLGIIYIDSTDQTPDSNFIGSNLNLFQVLVDQASIAILNAMLYENVNVDKLTGLFLRSFFEQNLEQELSYCQENGSQCSVLMIDIDFFKTINDRYGHQIGDEILKIIGSVIKVTLRNTDICGRYGGEEFIIILPNTNANQAEDVSQKIQKNISQTPFPSGPITISIGISCFPQHCTKFVKDETRKRIIKNADQALYYAKHNGRNRYEIWHSSMQNLQSTRSTAKEILSGNPIRDYRNVEMLLTVIQTITKNIDNDDILSQIIDLVLRSIDADRGIILLKNQMSGKLEPVIAREKAGTIEYTNLKYSVKTVDMVFITGKEICVNTIEDDFQSQSISEMEVKSIMCVALHQNNQRMGVFYLDSKKQIKEFSSTELSFFNAIATQISLLMQVSEKIKSSYQSLTP